MDNTRRSWLKALMALPAVVVGAKLLPVEERPEVKVAPKEELPMVRQGVMGADASMYKSTILTTSCVYFAPVPFKRPSDD